MERFLAGILITELAYNFMTLLFRARSATYVCIALIVRVVVEALGIHTASTARQLRTSHFYLDKEAGDNSYQLAVTRNCKRSTPLQQQTTATLNPKPAGLKVMLPMCSVKPC